MVPDIVTILSTRRLPALEEMRTEVLLRWMVVAAKAVWDLSLPGTEPRQECYHCRRLLAS